MWWILSTAFAVCALVYWRKYTLLRKAISNQFVVTKQQIHQIKNDLTSVCISLEGLSMAAKNTMPVEQFDVVSAATEYSNRLKREVCELLELESIQNDHQVSLRETKTNLSDIIKHREFNYFADSIKEFGIKKFGSQLMFDVDRSKLLQIVDSFGYAAAEFSESITFSSEFQKSDFCIIGSLVAHFVLKTSVAEFETSLSYQFVTKLSQAIGLKSHIRFDGNNVCWQLMLPVFSIETQNEQILIVSHAEDSTITDITKSMGRIVTSAKGIEEALCAIQKNCYGTVIFDGSKELGQQLALAKIMRHDLNIPSKTVLISPEKNVNPQLASEFGIDSVINAEQLKTTSI